MDEKQIMGEAGTKIKGEEILKLMNISRERSENRSSISIYRKRR